MSQTFAIDNLPAFILVPLNVLSAVGTVLTPDMLRAYERALEEARAVERPPIMERLLARAWN